MSTIRLRLSQDIYQKLEFIAKKNNKSKSSFLCDLIDKEYNPIELTTEIKKVEDIKKFKINYIFEDEEDMVNKLPKLIQKYGNDFRGRTITLKNYNYSEIDFKPLSYLPDIIYIENTKDIYNLKINSLENALIPSTLFSGIDMQEDLKDMFRDIIINEGLKIQKSIYDYQLEYLGYFVLSNE